VKMFKGYILKLLSQNNVATDLIREIEDTRRKANRGIDVSKKGELGQFMTPANIAMFMAKQFQTKKRTVRVLDPGAGVGSLITAFVGAKLQQKNPPNLIEYVAFEIDPYLTNYLKKTLNACKDTCDSSGIKFEYKIQCVDFIDYLCSNNKNAIPGDAGKFDCIIMNPPYKKIKSKSQTRAALRQVGIETSNLYSAFMLLAARQLKDGGEFVSITPRSFCNGPYFNSFRNEFLDLISLRKIHVIESRHDAFYEDKVLQENIIIYGLKSSRKPRSVKISCSHSSGKISKLCLPFEYVVHPKDKEKIVHVIIDKHTESVYKKMQSLNSTLEDLGIQVSTGRVVDFRARDFLHEHYQRGDVPLIYPGHFEDGKIKWPKDIKKPNAIVHCKKTEELLVPSQNYVLVKRFSAKEELRRIVASYYAPQDFNIDAVGFENKINYYHKNGSGLHKNIALGLTIYLNSTIVDDYFRIFSGHTQVNANDLRRLRYPSIEQLIQTAKSCNSLNNQTHIDAAVNNLI